MQYLFWIIIGTIGSLAIYWLIEWSDNFKNGDDDGEV